MSFATLFTSCKEEHNVPPFPEELTNYFPYKKGESFSFVSEDNDTLTFIASEATLSPDQTHVPDYITICSPTDAARMNMSATIDTNASSSPYCNIKNLAIVFDMVASHISPKSDGTLSMGFAVLNNDDGCIHISYGNDFECSPYEGNVNMVIGDEIILYDNMYQESLGLKAKVKWNEGILNFDFDEKQWTTVK